MGEELLHGKGNPFSSSLAGHLASLSTLESLASSSMGSSSFEVRFHLPPPLVYGFDHLASSSSMIGVRPSPSPPLESSATTIARRGSPHPNPSLALNPFWPPRKSPLHARFRCSDVRACRVCGSREKTHVTRPFASLLVAPGSSGGVRGCPPWFPAGGSCV